MPSRPGFKHHVAQTAGLPVASFRKVDEEPGLEGVHDLQAQSYGCKSFRVSISERFVQLRLQSMIQTWSLNGLRLTFATLVCTRATYMTVISN
jgi:hypothetical protein